MSKNLTSEAKKVLEEFNKDKKYEHYREEEKLIIELFTKHKENTDEKAVLLKVCILDSFYSTNLRMLGEGGVYEMAKHIVKLGTDKDLQNKSLELISKIADFTSEKGKRKVLYSFATKYCFFHNPNFYIIYDSFVEKALIFYNKKDKFYKTKFTQNHIKDYTTFMDIFKSFKSFYALESFNNRELDHFLWIEGKELEKQNQKTKKEKKWK